MLLLKEKFQYIQKIMFQVPEEIKNIYSWLINIKHPQLAQIYYLSYDPSKNIMSVFMEYLSGGSLQDLIKFVNTKKI